MQWTDGENAGFTTGTPWLKVNSNYTDINVKNQEADAHSVLNYYRKLIALRKSDEYKSLFTYGEFVPVYNDTESIMAFYRKDESKCVLIAANFGKEPASVTLKSQAARILLSTRPDGSVQIDTTSAPVSYTHLDVYKRQIMYSKYLDPYKDNFAFLLMLYTLR